MRRVFHVCDGDVSCPDINRLVPSFRYPSIRCIKANRLKSTVPWPLLTARLTLRRLNLAYVNVNTLSSIICSPQFPALKVRWLALSTFGSRILTFKRAVPHARSL